MEIRPAEISEILKKQIAAFDTEANVAETGQVLSVGDGIARVFGLQNCMAGEMVEFPGAGLRGMALNLETDNVGVVIFGDDRQIREGDTVAPTGTSTIEPVRDTVSPSRICLSSPKITTPTLSVSRFSAMPRRPAPGNSTISPAMQFCRPNMRAMPSPTLSTWPVSATLASVSNAAICFFRISEISAGRISISGGSLHGELQALQAGFQRGIVEAGADPHDKTAEQVGFH